MHTKERGYHPEIFVERSKKHTFNLLRPYDEPVKKQKKDRADGIPEFSRYYYKCLDDFMVFMAKHLLTSIKANKYSLRKFEALCLLNGYNFHRRSIHGIINRDRGDFRLSYFVIPFGLLGLTLDDVMKAYIDSQSQTG